MPRLCWPAGAFACLLLACCAPAQEQFDGLAAEQVDFNQTIRPILNTHCVACHGGVKQAAGVSFLRPESVLAVPGEREGAIVPGDPLASSLLDRIRDPDDETRMPPPEHGPRLSADEVEAVRRWIAQGAEWRRHWSLTPPRDVLPPRVERDSWPRGDIDRFVLRRIEAAGLQPSPEADRLAWLRRVSFDLIGLPPTAVEREAFAADAAPNAEQRVVDRLLASPHFGERWASVWLDLARYADSMGYEKDPHRDIWPYRDWVIRAFNAGMPYDEFLIKQLAGDLLPAATLEDRLATAFHRNTQTNTEAGTDDEEFRTAAVLDRVATTWQALMGSTFACAQCHDHPYDDFTQRDYYRFAAFFNNSRDADVAEDLPLLLAPVDTGRYAEASRIDEEAMRLRAETHRAVEALAAGRGQWRGLSFDQVESTGSTELAFVADGASGGELIASGTITNRSRYTLGGPLPGLTGPVTALRIEVLPTDAELAKRISEPGFLLSYLRVEVLTPGMADEEVFLAEAFGDDPHPEFDPRETLRDNGQGWAAYTRLFGPRRAVFVLEEPLELAEDQRLRLTLKQNREVDDQSPLAIQRARFSVSTDEAWTEFLRSPDYLMRSNRLAELAEARRSIPTVPVPVLAERPPALARESFAFDRGSWLDKTDRVTPGTPASMPPLSARAEQGGADRLDLARWVASPSNPLTARTMVNRLWAELFGQGLVETQEDFGAAGVPPSHPKLLDHLADRFAGELRWGVKRLLREMVLSATYRQDARVPPELLASDPRHRLLARGPRQRLTAEMVRDQALVVSGRLSRRRFGPPVRPPQPESVWKNLFSQAAWETSAGDDRFRRAIYTYWKRTAAYPSLLTFDTPARDVCVARRVPTNTPLQALVTMNDPAFVELSVAFGERIVVEGGATTRERLAWGYLQATGKLATEAVVATLEVIHQAALQRFADDPAACTELAPTAACYASAIIAGVLLNLDEALTR